PGRLRCPGRAAPHAGRGSRPAMDRPLQPAPRGRDPSQGALPMRTRPLAGPPHRPHHASLAADEYPRIFIRGYFLAALGMIALALCVSAAPAQDPKDDDWDSFRNGFHLRGVADSTLPEKLEELWTYPTEYGVASTAAIKDGRVYI